MAAVHPSGWLADEEIGRRSMREATSDRLRNYVEEPAAAHYALGNAADQWCSLLIDERVRSWLQTPNPHLAGTPSIEGRVAIGVQHVFTGAHPRRTVVLPDSNDDDQLVPATTRAEAVALESGAGTWFGHLLESRVADDPHWFFTRGMFAVTLLLAAAAALMATAPTVGLFVVFGVLVGWGLVILMDAAIRGDSVHDTRLATLLVLAGLGSIVVATVERLVR